MGLVLFVYALSGITEADKKATDIKAPGLHIIQYYNICETVTIMMMII